MVQKAEQPPSGPNTVFTNLSGHWLCSAAKQVWGRKKGCTVRRPLFVGTSAHVKSGDPSGLPKSRINDCWICCGLRPLDPVAAIVARPRAPCSCAACAYSCTLLEDRIPLPQSFLSLSVNGAWVASCVSVELADCRPTLCRTLLLCAGSRLWRAASCTGASGGAEPSLCRIPPFLGGMLGWAD